VQNRNMDGWWECTSRTCGHKIQFRMLDKVSGQNPPTCFCGSGMKRPYAKPRLRCGDWPIDSGAVTRSDISLQLLVLPLDAITTFLIPGFDA
jgi:hypothetical protein